MKNYEKELKPCPFCGGKKLVITNCEDLDTYGNNYNICCDFNQGGCGASSGYRSSIKEAVELWNKRANDKVIDKK